MISGYMGVERPKRPGYQDVLEETRRLNPPTPQLLRAADT
jgi:hypothetical protein